MQPEIKKYLHDILESAEEIQAYIGNVDFTVYQNRSLIRSAVERKFEIIGEALNRLQKRAPGVFMQISQAPRIIDFRNFLAHGYDIIDQEIVWDIIKN